MPGQQFFGFGVRDGLKADAVVRPVAEAVHLHPQAQRVHDRGAHAVQAAGIIVVVVVKLAPGVQLGINQLYAGNLQRGVGVGRHAAAVVPDAGGAVLVQGDGDLGGEIIGSLVHRVVHDLPQQVVQAAGAGGANVHAGPEADRVQFLQHLDIF